MWKNFVRWILLTWLIKTNRGDDHFIANKYAAKDYYCLTNTTFALSWTVEHITETLHQESQLLPTQQQNNFNSDIIDNDYNTKSNFIKYPWKLQNSLESHVNQVIFDRRWEGFKTFKTDYTNAWKKPLEFIKVLDNITNDFEIPISIRAKREAHILFCDGSHPASSNCYWLLLQGFQGNRSGIRKCGYPDFVPRLNNDYAQNECKIERDSVEHQHFPNYLTPTKWSHLKLSKKQNVLMVTLVTYHEDKKILEFPDFPNSIAVTHMFIHGKEANALWKVHRIDYIYTNDETSNIPLGQPFYPLQNEVCIAMFVSMCDSCKLKLSLANQGVIIDENIFHSGHSRWTELKFITRSNQYKSRETNLLVSTIGQSPERFWAIDKVRLCREREFRMISLTDKASCQLMSGDNNVISFANAEPSAVEIPCPENTIGDFCVPCDTMVYGNCNRMKICTKQRCFCSAGYQGRDCSSECAKNENYGHGCQQTCGKCNKSWYQQQVCNNVDGTCSSGCNDMYTGPKCNIPPSIIFKNAPEVTDVSTTSATIAINDFAVESSLNTQQLQLHSYTVQFKKEDSTEEMWESQNPSYEFGKSNVVVIENLEADTRYFVRAVITTGDGQLNIGPHVKYSKFTTKCEDISLDGATLKSTNTSVKLILIRNVSSCKLSRYQIFLKENNRNPNLNENYVVFEGLKPFTHYTIIFQHSSSTTQEKKFQTTEGVPDKISSTIITGKSTTSVDLKWVAPLINGHFLHYVVEYELGSHLACGPQEEYSTDIKRLQTTDTSISINDLSPYSNYSFSIFAANSIFQGAPYTFIESTLSSETIGSEEIPKINITAGMFDSNVGLLFDCANLKGPIIIKTTLKCLNEWCNNQSNNRAGRRLNTTNFGPTTTLDNLIPFTDYVFEAIFCRNETNCRNEPENVSFKTEPSVPNIPTDVLIYNKNESSISLRWKPPYPPTGILQEYKIVNYYIMNRATHSTDQFVNIASCRIWQDFHCTTLYDLKPNKRYNIEISSRNINPSNFSLPSSIVRGDTKIDKSDPPYNVSVFWTDLNDLELRWNHPNRTNGDVQYFGINVNSRSESVHRKLFVNDFNVTLNYNYTIDAEELTPTTNYKIKIWAYNAYFGDEAKVTTMSPPDIPKLSYESGVVSESNDSLTLKISLEEPQGEHERVQLLVFVEESRNDMASGERRNVINCTIRNFNEDLSIMIGKYTQQQEICISPKHTAFNLEAGTHYNITVLLENSFRGMTRRSAHFYSGRTLGEPKSVGRNMSLLGLLALVFIIAIAAAVYVKRNKLKSMKDDFFQRQTTSAEVLDKHDDQIPLSNVEPPTVVVQSQKKTIKTQKDDNPNSKTKIYSKCVKVTEFEEYVKECLMNGELQRQHSLFPRGPTKAWNYGSVKENKSKNRYNNLIAYDHSRVVLQKLSDVPHSDYINASYINGHRVPKAYIATQGPKQATLNDFWRMIWQENVSHIANLANIYEGGKKKVEKYWPDVNETLQFGNISVQHDGSKVYADYEHRMFIVSQGETSRKVDQLHFSSWPDHGVPLYSQSLVPFLRSMLHLTTNSNSPIVVHCSAGVGRTGTILLCDICLRMAAREGKIDVLRNLQLLRDQRANMVDNIEQYKLAHLVILECLVGMHTNIPCLEIEKSVEKLLANDGLDLQLRYLKETQWQDEAMKSVTQVDEDVSVVAEKNRFPNIIPDISGRIFIPHYPVDDETSSYINAVKVDGFRSIGRYIVTQQPMPNTLSDFWRLVDSCNLSVVISLNEINPKDQTCCRFWPTAGHPQMTPVPIITLKHANTVCLDHYDLITVHLFTNSRKEHLQVYIISLKKWQPGTATPDGIKDFLAFWEKSDAIARRSNPAIITCYDGVTACGLYVAMSFLIEKMKLEQICDVCQAVRTVRHNRQQFVQDVEQFEFLYRSAVAYISEFESYANFT